MMNVMKRAWEIYRTLTGDRIAKLSMALRQAWTEVKNVVKSVKDEVIEAIENIINKSSNARYDYKIICKDWQNYGKDRTYIKVIESRKCDGKPHADYDFGYIDNKTNEYVSSKWNANQRYTLSRTEF